MSVKFRKMHGLGNDFVIIDGRSQALGDLPALAQKIADRHFGVGCDQVIILSKDNQADIRMTIYNPDGSEAGMCGNASRCVATLIIDESGQERISIATVSGILEAKRAEKGLVCVDMGEPRLDWAQIPMAKDTDTRFVPIMLPTSTDPGNSENFPVAVSMGNPHCVFFLEKGIEDYPVAEFGPAIEKHALFPQKTNVEFVQVLDRAHIRMRVWERGTGITLACGSGACASAVAAMRRSYVDRTVTVRMDGGELEIEWRASDNRVYMTGPVAFVFEGNFQG